MFPQCRHASDHRYPPDPGEVPAYQSHRMGCPERAPSVRRGHDIERESGISSPVSLLRSWPAPPTRRLAAGSPVERSRAPEAPLTARDPRRHRPSIRLTCRLTRRLTCRLTCRLTWTDEALAGA